MTIRPRSQSKGLPDSQRVGSAHQCARGGPRARCMTLLSHRPASGSGSSVQSSRRSTDGGRRQRASASCGRSLFSVPSSARARSRGRASSPLPHKRRRYALIDGRMLATRSEAVPCSHQTASRGIGGCTASASSHRTTRGQCLSGPWVSREPSALSAPAAARLRRNGPPFTRPTWTQ